MENKTEINQDECLSLSPEEMLRQSELRSQEHYDAWMYAKAELENVRRRHGEDINKVRIKTIESVLESVFEVKDAIDMAINTDNGQNSEGLCLIIKKIEDLYIKHGISPVAASYDVFNPHYHQAISVVTTSESDNMNKVCSVLQQGYKIGDRILRPALVTVYEKK